MKALLGEIVTIGDELLIGQVINTNQAFIAERSNSVGIYIDRMTTVGDREEAILDAFSSAFQRYDVVFVTGGLGPTHDDITKKVVCKFFETDLVMNPEVRLRVQHLMKSRNLPWTSAAEDQALVPRSCMVLENTVGTAPGMLFEQRSDDGKKYFVVMPGVPFEMKEMIDHSIIPFFSLLSIGNVVRHRTLKTTGIAESMLAAIIGDVTQILGDDGTLTLAFLPSPYGTRLRLTARAQDSTAADEKLSIAEKKICEKAEEYIYTADERELEDVVAELLISRQLTIATAESCTGGFLSHRLTNISGSSAYFLRGFITYSNQSKKEELGIDEGLIELYGSVSAQVAKAMALGAQRTSGTDIGISLTGIAGPTGGTPEKPAGLVWIGYADKESTFALKFNFGDHRVRFKERASQAALELLRRMLLGKKPQLTL